MRSKNAICLAAVLGMVLPAAGTSRGQTQTADSSQATSQTDAASPAPSSTQSAERPLKIETERRRDENSDI